MKRNYDRATYFAAYTFLFSVVAITAAVTFLLTMIAYKQHWLVGR